MPTPDDGRAVLETLHRLQNAIDARDWEAVEASFLPDATAYGARGTEAIMATMQAHLGGVGPTQHLIGNSIVEFDEDGATVLSAARVYHVGAGSKEGSFFECLGDYTDRFVATAEGWQLCRRRFDMRITLGDVAVLRPAEAD